MTHPARSIPFADLVAGLQAANDNGHVNVQENGALRLYTYSKSCVYDRAWTPFTRMARGLILDHANENVVATPFVKFFNCGERDYIGDGNDTGAGPEIPNLPFEVYEKVDGSLIIIFWHEGRWRTATKGSFNSDQAVAAQRLLDTGNTRPLWPGETYLAEYVGPQNRIVVNYEFEGLVLLGAYRADGQEFTYQDLLALSLPLGWRVADRHHFDSFSDLLATAPTLPATQEGFVVRFSNGYRLKIKGDEYCRLHRCISNVTPLAIWEAMVAGADMDAMRRELPEEFWVDFDYIRLALASRAEELIADARYYVECYNEHSDKEIGLLLSSIYPEHIRSLIFPLRKQGETKVRAMALKMVRPKGNHLEGYRPSSAMQRVESETV